MGMLAIMGVYGWTALKWQLYIELTEQICHKTSQRNNQILTKPVHKLSHLHSTLVPLPQNIMSFFLPLMVSMVIWFPELVAKEQPLRQSGAVVMSGL